MTPTPKEHGQTFHHEPVEQQFQGDSVVISGMSGVFPMSESINDITSILYNKINPVSSDNSRWEWTHPEASEYIGKVPGIDLFDSQFFMVHSRLGKCMDPMARKALEHSYEAIYDAGLNIKELNRKKVGVYIGASMSETEKAGFFEHKSKAGFGITGCSKTMYANRISYWLNAKGPSLAIDDACCGSMVALEEAFLAIKSGNCESALVAGSHLCLLPYAQVHINRCIKISPDNKTRSFDENACGCTKSESIIVFFLQKAKHALRAYAEVVHIKNEFLSNVSGASGQVFGFIRNPDSTTAFLKRFYEEIRILPQTVEYVEAFGSADSEADKAELQTIEKVFCDNRMDPLLVGSIMSNIGYTEAASGANGILKVLLAYHHGLIASNLNCSSPRQDVAALREGRMQVVTEHRPFRGTYAAVNCLSITGVNSHVLLRGCTKPKVPTQYKTSFPRLVTISARQDAYLQNVFLKLEGHPIDPEEIALLHNIHCNNIPGHLGRGYTILDTDNKQQTISLIKSSQRSDEVVRPLWFVYSGMGSQWAGMGVQLMRIPIFAAAIERCHNILEPKGLDIVHIVTSPDKSIFDNVLNSFVGIAAIQIGLTDVLTALGLQPDNIIGHSVGELGCAYADGCLTAEEMILSAYSRGKASNDTPLIRGAMAAVGLGYEQLSKLCPPAIEVACHNSSGSSTISGPEENIREFIALLTANGVFAKEVPSANIAYHSRYIADAGPRLFNLLSEVIKEPRARSDRWVSTSVPQERWSEPIAKYCSTEYLTNNLLSPVLFEETIKLIPANAVLVEVAPHGLLQAILKRALPDSCTNIPLTQREHKDNALFLLDAIGKLYVEGYTPKVQALYPKVRFPVSTGTPHLSHYVKWNHNESWSVPVQRHGNVSTASMCTYLITTHDEEYEYIKGNIVEGKVVYPFAGALVAVWDTLAMTSGVPKKQMSVTFSDVHLCSQPILHAQKVLRLNVTVHRGSGHFEVMDENLKIASGYINTVEDIRQPDIINTNKTNSIGSDEIYEYLSSRGYPYRDEFQSIACLFEESLTSAEIIWKDNWVTFIDGLLQLNTLKQVYYGVSQPTHIRELTIDVHQHLKSVQQLYSSSNKTLLKANVDAISDSTRCGGVSIHNIKFRNLPTLTRNIYFDLTTESSNSSNDKYKVSSSCDNITSIKDLSLQIGVVGDLDTLHWEDASLLPEEGVKVLVHYAGVNISDMRKATGVIPYENDKPYYGNDFSGTTESGERVMGVVQNGTARSVVSARAELLWPVPAHWTLEEAATVPLAYLQALYCLCVRGELKRGSRVLVHGAAGALGQAAVTVALAHGATVFATVGDQAKKRFLLRLFPQLQEFAVGNSRETSFGDMVLSATNGYGCDIILSCVRVGLKNISSKCVAFSGITIDTTQIQSRDAYEYGMFNMTKSRSYCAIDFNSIFNIETSEKLQQLLSSGISTGAVRPLSRVTFPPHEAARAFRLLVGSRHRGRVLLRLHDPLPRAIHRLKCSTFNSHLIVWDGNQFGLQLVDRLITRGARKIRIFCEETTNGHKLKLRMWQQSGIDVKILSQSLTGSDDIYSILDETSRCGPVEGIYVTACSQEPNEKWASIIDHLDTSSRIMCPLLKYFAIISLKNNMGHQTSLLRSNDGFPATALALCYNKDCMPRFDESCWNQCAGDVTEQALLSGSPALSAQIQVAESRPLHKLLSTISGKRDESCTLQELGISEFLPSIKLLLRDVYHITLPDEKLSRLTKKQVLEMELSTSERSYEDVRGLHILFSYVDDDELSINTELTPMNTLVYDVETMEDAIDENRTTLFIIPGLEGHHARFRTLCERLKLPAFVLQPGLDVPNETLREQAYRHSKVLLEKFKLKDSFYLFGYECGVFVALELASILEENGLTGTVYCLGLSPSVTRALLERELESFSSEDALQEGVVRHMYTLMTRGSAAPVDSALHGCQSWSERVNACVRMLRSRVPHSAQYVRALLDTAYARITMTRNYRTTPRQLRSRLILLRVSRYQDNNELQLYTTQPLIVEDIAAPMAYATSDLRVPAIINKYLGDDLIKIFNNYNLCDVYLTE